MMQSQDMTSKTTTKVPKRQVFREKGNKIKDALKNLDIFRMFSRSYCMACMPSYLLFFFLWIKKHALITKNSKAAQKYTGSIQKGQSPEKDQKHEEKIPKPENNYLYPIQVKKSKILLSLSPLDMLA